MDDWQIVVNLAKGLGVELSYRDTTAVRADIAARFASAAAFSGIASLSFGQPMEGRHWLEANNPSERWKWDFMFQDLPPVKGYNVQMEGMPQGAIPLTPVASKP
jgi:hypothetical protein